MRRQSMWASTARSGGAAAIPSDTMTGLTLQGTGADWQLHLNGDWSLTAMAPIETQLSALPDTVRGTLVCDWSRAERPGIGPAWALLVRLSGFGSPPLEIRPVGDPPPFPEFLQKPRAERQAARPAAQPEPSLERSVGELGRWAVHQGNEARAVIGFFGRMVRVCEGVFSRPQALRPSSLA